MHEFGNISIFSDKCTSTKKFMYNKDQNHNFIILFLIIYFLTINCLFRTSKLELEQFLKTI